MSHLGALEPLALHLANGVMELRDWVQSGEHGRGTSRDLSDGLKVHTDHSSCHHCLTLPVKVQVCASSRKVES